MHGRPQFSDIATAPRDFRRLSQGGRAGLWNRCLLWPCADDGFDAATAAAALALSGATARRHRCARLETAWPSVVAHRPTRTAGLSPLGACFLCGATQSWGVWRDLHDGGHVSPSRAVFTLFDRDARPTDRRR